MHRVLVTPTNIKLTLKLVEFKLRNAIGFMAYWKMLGVSVPEWQWLKLRLLREVKPACCRQESEAR